MKFHVRTWRLPLRMLALVLVAAAVPWPCLAAEPGQPAQRPRLQASIAPIVKEVAARPASSDEAVMKAAARQQAPTPDRSALEKKSFFKTGPGVAVLLAVAAGTGYAIYTASHDRIHSTVPSGLQ